MPQFNSLFEAQSAYDALEASGHSHVTPKECHACGYIPGQPIKAYTPAPGAQANQQPPAKLAAVPRVVKPVALSPAPANPAPQVPVSYSHALHIKKQKEEEEKFATDAQKKIDDLAAQDEAAAAAGVTPAGRIIDLDQFHLLSSAQKMEFIRGGGKLLKKPGEKANV